MSKIAGIKNEATELAIHKIELATADEIASKLKALTSMVPKYSRLSATIQKNAAALNVAYKDMLVGKDVPKNFNAALAKLETTLTKQANELGVDVKQLPAFKQLMDGYAFADEINTAIQGGIDAVKTIGK
jgi:hypothetical protein